VRYDGDGVSLVKMRLLRGSPPLFLEYEDVLKRPEQRLAHGLTPEAVDEFLAELAALIERVDIDFSGAPKPETQTTKWFLKSPSMAGRLLWWLTTS
jgi:hypothetical protein